MKTQHISDYQLYITSRKRLEYTYLDRCRRILEEREQACRPDLEITLEAFGLQIRVQVRTEST